MEEVAIFLAALLLLVFTWTAEPCNTYKFSGDKKFFTCQDLPVLNSSLHWSYDQSSGRVDLAFRHTVVSADRRWIAWAINPTAPAMIGSQALVAFRRSDGTLAGYTSPITSYGTKLQPGNLSFPVFDMSATQEKDEIIIFASFGLANVSTAVNHIWQEGPLSGDTPMMHSLTGPNLRSVGSLDFLSGKVLTTSAEGKRDSKTTLKYVHGAVNTLGWGILMPTGAIIARHLKEFKSANPLWFYVHVGCQLTAYLLGVAGFATGLVLGNMSPGIQYSAHRYIGSALFGLATAQVGVGFIRPDKDSNKRPYFNWFHYIAGYSTIILSIGNIFEGLRLLHGGKVLKFAYIGILATLASVAVALEATKWLILRRAKNQSTESTGPVEVRVEV